MKKKNNYLKKALPYCYITPITLILLVFVVGSLFISIWLGFTKYNIISPPVFSGLSNYKRLLLDVKFIKALKNTIKLTVIITPLNTFLGLILSVFLVSNRNRFLGKVANAAVFIPYLCSGAVVGVVWREFLNGGYGPITQFFQLFGINPAMLLGDAKTALLTAALICVWKDLGYYAVIYSSGLLGIPDSYYEAAKVDGAGVLQRFFKITLPILKPTLILVVFLSVTTSLSVMDMIMTMTGGGPNNASTTLVIYTYSLCFGAGKAGLAMAISNVLFLVVLALVLTQRRMLSRSASEV